MTRAHEIGYNAFYTVGGCINHRFNRDLHALLMGKSPKEMKLEIARFKRGVASACRDLNNKMCGRC